LRAVAVVKVHIQHHNPLATLIQTGLRGNGRIVQIAVTPHVFCCRMVAGWAAQRKSTVVALQQMVHGAERRIRATAHRLPGAAGDGYPGIHRIKPQLAVDMFRFDITAQIPHGPHQWQRIVLMSQCAPLLPGLFQKSHVALAVYPCITRAVIVRRPGNLTQAAVAHTLQNGVGTVRHFKAG
jgi:hypothetical protein